VEVEVGRSDRLAVFVDQRGRVELGVDHHRVGAGVAEQRLDDDYNAKRRTIDISGRNMQASRKFRNVADNGRVAFVVDDIASIDPWRVRCLEACGHAEALTDPADSATGFPGPIIRIHPRRIISFGIDPPHLSLGKRNVTDAPS